MPQNPTQSLDVVLSPDVGAAETLRRRSKYPLPQQILEVTGRDAVALVPEAVDDFLRPVHGLAPCCSQRTIVRPLT
jgi:hypothetical protein